MGMASIEAWKQAHVFLCIMLTVWAVVGGWQPGCLNPNGNDAAGQLAG